MALSSQQRGVRPLRAISTCTGYGGVELGLRLAGIDICTVCYVEREAYAVENLVAKMEAKLLDDAPIWSDLATFPSQRFCGCVDLVTGGIPCQPFSVAGKKQGLEDERWLWPDFWRLVRGVGAGYIFLENVRGFVSAGLPAVTGDLAGAGWRYEWDLFSAAQLGAPHKRERLFLLAHDRGAESNRIHTRSRSEGWQRTTEDRGAPSTDKELVDTGHDELHRRFETAGPRQGKHRQSPSGEPAPSNSQGRKEGPNEIWPAGPTEPQHEWEADRIVSESRGGHGERRASRSGRRGGKPSSVEETRAGIVESATQPGLGGSAYGPAPRVDRLRLDGNGVVPIVAGCAFVVLGRRLGLIED